ncbi:ATP-dependent helicase [Pseudomonas luteola]
MADFLMNAQQKIDQIVSGLNDEQKIAALHLNGPLQLIAGAGAGKTRTLIHKTAVMLTRGIPASEILLVTFTNKAATEIKHRLHEMVGEDAQYITAGTFHSIIYSRILKKYFDAPYLKELGYDFTQTSILDESESTKLYKEAWDELPEDDRLAIDDNEWDINDFREDISKAKAFGMDCNDMLKQLNPKNKTYEFDRICTALWHRYTEKCKTANGIDFDDILTVAAKLLQNSQEIGKDLSKVFGYIMLDEYQDTNPVQMMIMDEIAQHHHNITVVGDEKQSIYGFRYAEIRVMLEFAKRYPNVLQVNMNRNYRSNALNIQWANACAHHMKQKLSDGQLKAESKLPHKSPKAIMFADEIQEASILVKAIMKDKREGVQGKEIAVLYRNRNVKNELERELVKKGLQYMIVGDTSFYQRAEVKDAIAMLRFVFRPWDSMAGMRFLKAAKMGVSPDSAKSAMEEGITPFNHLKAQADKKLKAAGKAQNGDYTAAAKKVRPFLGICQDLRESVSYGDSPAFVKEVVASLWDIYLLPKLANVAKKNIDTEKTDESHNNKLENVKLVFENFEKGLERGLTVDQVLDEFSMMTESHPDMDRNNDEKIRLMTIHASKGLEFDNVYMIGMDNATFKEDLSDSDLEEERRNTYVGITRCKQKLILSYSRNRKIYGEPTQTDMSPFLKEILRTVGHVPLDYNKHVMQQAMSRSA